MANSSRGRGHNRGNPPRPARPAAASMPAVPAAPAATPATTHAILQARHAQTVGLLQQIETQRNSKVLTYVLNPGAGIADDVVEHLYGHLRRLGHQPRLDLYLSSMGGATEVPWRIVSLIREFTDHFAVLLPYRAASAATHISLGADEIVMTEIAQLGPVDPSRQHPLLPTDPFGPAGQPAQPLSISVQDLRHFIKFVEKEGEDEGVKPEDASAIYVELMRHVHPLVIGAMEQSYALAKLITKNMLSLHMDPVTDADDIARLADHLSDDFKSHVYPINRREAREMGLKVEDTTEPLRDAMWALYEFYRDNTPTLPNQKMPNIGGVVSLQPIAYVESTAGSVVGCAAVSPTDSKTVGTAWVYWFA